MLITPDWDKSFVQQTDASATGLSYVLSQIIADGEEHPIAFGSKKLLPREINYSAIEREALAIVKGIQHFRTYLEGTSFKIETDHNPLTHLSTLKDSHGRLARWDLSLQPFDFRIVHRSGKANANADGLLCDQGYLFKEGGMSEIGTLTGVDPAERVEVTLGQPISSREQSREMMLQEGKPQNQGIITPYIPTEQVIITPCTYSPDRTIILNKLPEAHDEGDWPAVKHASGITSKRRVSCLGN